VHTIDDANASTTRSTLDATLATLTSATAANQAEFAGIGIQAPSARDSALVRRVLSSRAVAVTNLNESVMLATTPSASAHSAAVSCVAAQAAIRVADGAIGTLDGVFRAISGIAHQQFRKWSTYSATLSPAGCSDFVHTLRANQSLVLRPSLKLMAISVLPSPVQVNGVPNPATTTTTSTTVPLHATTTTSTTFPTGFGTTTSTSSTTTTTTTTIAVTTTTLQIPPQSARSVLPPTSTVTADVVVADTGDAPVHGVTVTVQVASADGQSFAERSDTVNQIAADSSAYLTIGPVALKKVSGTFLLKVAASASGVASSKQVITLVRSS
jgi:hypothetical protein